MSRRKNPEDNSILLLILLTIHATGIDAGATSPQKNLVNLYTNSPNDNQNATNTNQFQNEYQHHQSASKVASPDRFKTSNLSNTDAPAADHIAADPIEPILPDFYQDVKVMTNVPECRGRLTLNGTRGYITDGPGYYETNLQCVWLIDSGRDNATIRIQVHQFNTECNYDFLYIFDGNSIYSPLVAALSGDMKDFSSAFVDPRLENLISIQDNKQKNNNNSFTTNQVTQTYGAITPATTSESRPFELKTESGKAFIYFHSDTAQEMPGFYMTYSIDACPLDCYNRGECDYNTLNCKCNPGFFGDGCQYVLCPNNCTSPTHGRCDEEKSCICNQGFDGLDCSKSHEIQTWTPLANASAQTSARAFHQSVVVNNTMWVIGGKTPAFSNTNTGIYRKKSTPIITSFDVPSKRWNDFIFEGLTGVDHLAELSGHSVATHGEKVFIYGGLAMNNTVLDTLTVLNTRASTIDTLISPKQSKSDDEQIVAPLAVVGHTAVIVDGDMYVFLGYNPLYGYINFVQKFNIANNSWSIVEKKGSSVVGVIGHSSSFDLVDRLIYVYGGHNAFRSDRLYSFDPQNESWKLLQPGPSPRYYHSSAIINRQLIIFGGNSYDTSHRSDQCFQQTYLTFDLDCSIPEATNDTTTNENAQDCVRKCWKSIDDEEPGVLRRHGHSLARHNDQLILFGGFNGVFMRDIRLMNIGSCDMITREAECAKTKLAMDCQWNSSEKKCEPASNKFSVMEINERANHECSKSTLKSIRSACAYRETCTDCLSTGLGCVWCAGLMQCLYGKCESSRANPRPVTNIDFCYKDELAMNSSKTTSTQVMKDYLNRPEAELEFDCRVVENCYLCHSKPHCSWQYENCLYNPQNIMYPPRAQLEDPNESHSGNSPTFRTGLSPSTHFRVDPFRKSVFAAFTNSLMNTLPLSTCDVPCYMRRSCNECTTTKCIWCSTTEQCIDSTAYFAYHSAGQCMHYVAHMLKCSIASCADIETCDKCLANPKCGWLNDISNTGKGRCIEGTSLGPTSGNFIGSTSIVGSNSTSLPSSMSNWFYNSCPSCQCNGHSYCRPNSSLCVQSCQDNTEGPNCDRCIQGYYGDPINGGVCRPCRCNGHAQTCNRETGKCYCSTKGIVGHNCNRCDDKNYYIGDPSIPGNGTCYYNLTTDYQYTFNISKPEDHFYSDINFINLPLRKDSDVDFTIACSRLALVNITAGTSYKDRRLIHTSLECGSFRLRFPHDRLMMFTDANYSFFVHVHKFQTPFILQIAFSQHRTIFPPQFFFTFSSSLLFFAALTGLVWKLKHEYDLYVRRQRQFIEMEQMASRPFSTVLLEVSKPLSGSKSSDYMRLPANEPTPISFEPCFGSNIGVMSLFVQLPGRPNLAIGSALVTLSDDVGASIEDECPIKRSDKEYTSVKNA